MLTTPAAAAIALGVALLVGAAGAASAQYPAGGGSSGGRAGRPGGGQPPGADARNPTQTAAESASELARTQLQELEEDLKLAPAQRAAWSGYSSKVRELADDVARNRNSLRFPKGPAPEQLDFVTETLRNRLTAVEDIMEAGKALYAVLAPVQRTVADDRLARIPIPLIAPVQSMHSGGPRGMPPGDAAPNAGRGR
ncbi:MAG: Spy/CpxP family protein refolding chaperone [Betaproteobacteria bacterium]